MTRNQPAAMRWAIALMSVGTILSASACLIERPLLPPVVMAICGAVWLWRLTRKTIHREPPWT